MGFAIADAFADRGAEVTLICGPVQIQPSNASVKTVNVTSAGEMFDACIALADKVDIAVFAAAVADFTPMNPAHAKIKRGKDDMVIKLQPTKDIAAELGKGKKANQLFVGFALETNDALANALTKLERKNLDLIVLNSLEDKGAGFGTETNKITLIDKSGNIDNFDLKPKRAVAEDIIDKILKLLKDA